MEKNKDSSLENYNKPFAKTLRDLLEGINSPLKRKINQRDLADKIEVSRQVISQYCNGITSPNVETLKSIAEFFRVSSDYLIGLSPVSSTNMDDKTIHDKIGLSEVAIETLKDWQKVIRDNFLIRGEYPPEGSHKFLFYPFEFQKHATIDFLLSNGMGQLLLQEISEYLYGDYISTEEDNTSVTLYNNRLGYNKAFDIKLLKAGLLVNVQAVLLECEKETSKTK